MEKKYTVLKDTAGIAVMCALRLCSFTDNEIYEKITAQTEGMLRLVKNLI